MPYGIARSDDERTSRHLAIYGGEPPETRLGMNQRIYPSEVQSSVTENSELIMLTLGIVGAYVFVEFILPRITNK